MRYAFTGSALLHLTALGAGLLMFNWPTPEDAPAEQSVSVAVISIAAVSTNEISTIESDASVTQQSSGAEAVAEAVPETVEAIEPETLEPIVEPVQDTEVPLEPEKTEPEQAQPGPAEPLPTDVPPEDIQPIAVAPLSAASVETLPADTAPPVTAEAVVEPVKPEVPAIIEPAETADPDAPPIPQRLTIKRTAEPTYPKPTLKPATPPKKPAVPPKKPEPVRVAEAKPPAPAGNGGQNDSDSAAGKPSASQQGNSGNGGDAEVARYQNLVQKKVRRALHRPKGVDSIPNDVFVQFTVSANGQASGIRILASSGNARFDEAAMKAITRAAPFPPIPAETNKSSLSFKFYLGSN